MKYNSYNLIDFVTDEDFINWVKNLDDRNNKFWQNWIAQNPHKKELVEEARHVVLFLSIKADQPLNDDFLEIKKNIFQQIKSEENNQPESKQVKFIPSSKSIQNPITGQKKYLRVYFKAAAIFIGLVWLASLLFYIKINSQDNKYTTEFGETKTILLPDSSTVVLNSNSFLKVPKSWDNDKLREVWLDGEAFFHVRKKELAVSNSSVPPGKVKFIVHVNNVQVEVLGTEFNVNNRRGMVKVILNSGQINLRSRSEKIAMKPGEMIEVSSNSDAFSKRSVEPEKYTSWRHQKLIFEETTIYEIAQIIEDNYGYKVEFKNKSLKHRRFTGVVPSQDVELFLAVLAESLDLKITKVNNNIIMYTK